MDILLYCSFGILCFSIIPLISIKHNGNGLVKVRLGGRSKQSIGLPVNTECTKISDWCLSAEMSEKTNTVPRLSLVFYIFMP